jgi:hypothetical protein
MTTWATCGGPGSPKKKGEQSALEAYCINLNKKAAEGKIDPLIGREPRSTAPSRFSAAARRTTRSSWAIPASARRRLPKASPARSSRAKFLTC